MEPVSIGGFALLRMRPLDRDEEKTLYKIQHRAKDGIARLRASILLSVARTQRCTTTAMHLGLSAQYVRRVVHAFRKKGLASIPQRYRGGRPRVFGEHVQQTVTELTLCKPREIGLAWSQWSLPKLVEVLIQRGVVASISTETVRRILRANRISYQRTKTWKESKDPAFQEKWQRVKTLYREKPPEHTAVVCVDEFGPIELRPYAGDHWAPEKHPQRLPATFHRYDGVRHFLAYYDVHANYLDGWLYERKRGEEFLDFLQRIRLRYAEQNLVIVLDNFSPHRRQDVQAWARENRVELVFIATNASWMNRIECHFAALKKFVLGGSYPTSHQECAESIRTYLAWRNSQPTHEAILKAQRRIRVA